MNNSDLLTQARIGERIRRICNDLYRGDVRRMSKATGINDSYLKDIMKSRAMSDDAIGHVVTRLCKQKTINKIWITSGQGKPYNLAGGIGPASPMTAENTDPTTRTPEPPKDPSPMNANGNGLDLFADLVRRVKAIEDKSNAPKFDPSALQRKIEEIAASVKASRETAESKHTTLLRTVQDQIALLGEAERVIGRVQAATLAIRSDLDQVMAEVQTMQEVLTAPKPEAIAPATISGKAQAKAEEMYDDDDVMGAASYLDLSGRLPSGLRDWGVRSRVLGNYASTYELLTRTDPPKANDGTTLYRIKSYRQFYLFLDARQGQVPKEGGQQLFRKFMDGESQRNGHQSVAMTNGVSR